MVVEHIWLSKSNFTICLFISKIQKIIYLKNDMLGIRTLI